MKRSERILLSKLRGANAIGDEEPLKNIKNEMGSLRNIVGNPMFKAEINFQITIQFGNTGVIGPILPGALFPANQNSVPIYLFGLTDFYGGLLKSQLINPSGAWARINAGCGIIGYQGFAFVAGPGFVQPVNGDLTLFYMAAAAGGTFDNAFIIVHCNSVAYGTFLNSFVSDLCICNQIRYFVPAANIIQLANPVIFAYQTLFGKIATDTIDPRMYQTPDEFQNQIVDIPVKFPIDKNLIISLQYDVFCPQISITFFIEKVEPLTLRPNSK